jgi:four helix bundle protein
MANIAEGFESETNKQFVQMLIYVKKSTAEVQSHLYVALDLKYITQEEFEKAYTQAELVRKITKGFIRYLTK